MLSVRIDEEIAEKVERVSKKMKITKSELVKNALKSYLNNVGSSSDIFEKSEDLIGKYSSGDINRSKSYKKIVKEKIHGKIAH